jgi:hypothetical protein
MQELRVGRGRSHNAGLSVATAIGASTTQISTTSTQFIVKVVQPVLM